MKKKILVTGGAGFIGLNFIEYLLKKNYNVINIDDLSYAANKKEHNKIKSKRNYKFFKINIKNKKKILYLLKKNNIYNVVNFAAETHVDNSIQKPHKFINNNIVFFFSFLESLNFYYQGLTIKNKKKFRFVHISTDEVYGSLDNNRKSFLETDVLKPNNPYSSSKASGELILRSFYKTYNFPYIITNSSNNYGKYQNDEKFIPKVFKTALSNEKIPIYGKGENIRDWIHVEDHCSAILKVLQKGRIGEKYNIGSNNETSNLNLVKYICFLLDKIVPKKISYSKQICYIKDRPGHDYRYSINANKIRNELSWRPKFILKKGLKGIANFYIAKNLN